MKEPRPLTDRELEVLRHMCLGYSRCEIARNLNLAVMTVRNQQSTIYRKTGTRGRTGAVVQAIRQGIMPLQVAYEIARIAAAVQGGRRED